jgi:hypothetical protein
LELVPEPESEFIFWKNWIPHSIYVAITTEIIEKRRLIGA